MQRRQVYLQTRKLIDNYILLLKTGINIFSFQENSEASDFLDKTDEKRFYVTVLESAFIHS